MFRRILCLLFAVVLLPAAVAAEAAEEENRKVFLSGETDPFPGDTALLSLRVCPLLGADAMLLTLGSHSMLVDTGRKAQAPVILDEIHAAGLEKVEYVFNTHPHFDHLGGMIPLLHAGLGVGTFLTVFPHDYVEDRLDFWFQPETIRLLEQMEIPVVDLKTEETIPFGDAEVTVLRLPDSEINRATTCNEMSAMLRIRYGNCSVLLTADVELTSEVTLAGLYDLKSDIMKYPHHGISYLANEFFDAVRPEYVFFTHGAGDTVRAQRELLRRGVSRMAFATWGTILLQTDGQKWIVSQEYLPDYAEIASTYVIGR